MPRARKAPPAAAPPKSTGRVLLIWLVQFILPLAAGVGLIVGVLWLSDRARDDLRRQGRHVVSFSDIECEPPPGLTRMEFLEETQYLAGLPDRLDLLDSRTPDRVKDALQSHPWVAGVRQVRIRGDRIEAEVEHRTPALWVEWSPRSARAVDVAGVLLPVSAKKDGLPILAGPVSRPVVRAGEAWGDPAVEAATKLVGWLRDRPRVVELPNCRIEVRGDELTLMLGKRRIIWGSPPGGEKPGEPDAATKAVRLRAKGEGDMDLRK